MAKQKKKIIDFARCPECERIDFEKFTLDGGQPQTRTIPCKCANEHDERMRLAIKEHPSAKKSFKRKNKKDSK